MDMRKITFYCMSILFFFLILSSFETQNIFGQTAVSTENFIVLSTFGEKTLVDQRVTIRGSLFDTSNNPVEETVEIKVFDLSNSINAKVIYSNVNYAKNGQFQDNGFIPPKAGIYTIVAESSDTNTTYNIRAVDFYQTNSFIVLLISATSFVLLVSLTGFINHPKIKLVSYRVLRFTLITIIAFGLVGIFLLTDIEIGTEAPMGIVIAEFGILDTNPPSTVNDEILDNFTKLDWILHIGGHSQDNFASGLKIPLFIIIAGALGGYIRILNYASQSWIKEQLLDQLEGDTESSESKQKKYNEIIKDANDIGKFDPVLSMLLTNRVIADLALLLISPVLAIVVYFILLQGGLNVVEDVWTLTVAGFAAGLFTETVISSTKEVIAGFNLFKTSRSKENNKSKK